MPCYLHVAPCTYLPSTMLLASLSYPATLSQLYGTSRISKAKCSLRYKYVQVSGRVQQHAGSQGAPPGTQVQQRKQSRQQTTRKHGRVERVERVERVTARRAQGRMARGEGRRRDCLDVRADVWRTLPRQRKRASETTTRALRALTLVCGRANREALGIVAMSTE
ncbi:hypothetical protein C8Q73DRAFT_141749 [Cubamyces lactineus]|nr:hypothetical protein C8Q73DRAFT_141749 [Cubamyces lactineus]